MKIIPATLLHCYPQSVNIDEDVFFQSVINNNVIFKMILWSGKLSPNCLDIQEHIHLYLLQKSRILVESNQSGQPITRLRCPADGCPGGRKSIGGAMRLIVILALFFRFSHPAFAGPIWPYKLSTSSIWPFDLSGRDRFLMSVGQSYALQ